MENKIEDRFRASPSALRGFGRQGYRRGWLPHHTVVDAQLVLGYWLAASERQQVIAGWLAERGEVCNVK